jgi:starch phosphorylase
MAYRFSVPEVKIAPDHSKLYELISRKANEDRDSLVRHFAHHLEYTVGKYIHNTTETDIYLALAYTLRDYLIDRWNETQEGYRKAKAKKVYYLSMEFLIGQMLKSNLVNLNAYDLAREILAELGYDLDSICSQEPDAGLGNGGLGRLAACFLDSMSSLDLPSSGCGLLYNFGIFRQRIVNGNQVEAPDNWLDITNPWIISRSDLIYPVGFGGYVEEYTDHKGNIRKRWVPADQVIARAHDILMPGFRTRTVNNLRLWKAEATEDFDFKYFNHGDYIRAVEEKVISENITHVLYPNENVMQGKELRLKQEYFLVSATIRDALREFFELQPASHDEMPDRIFFQLNDTHPALAVVELLRILVDEHNLEFHHAWQIVQRCFAYTNHTVMPEALERWPVGLLGSLLPRHLDLIYELNYYFLEDLRRKGEPEDVIARVSLIEEGAEKRVRMANLAIIGSSKVNGVSAIHTEIIKRTIFADFHRLYPDKMTNKTNGITVRRWLIAANPELTALINDAIGLRWLVDQSRLRDLDKVADDPSFQDEFHKIRQHNKKKLIKIIHHTTGVVVDPESMFDVQIKRIHEYKRQHLNVLRIIADYQFLKDNREAEYTPRTFIFAGKAAPGYHRARLIIKLIHSVAEKINNDRDVRDRMKVVFLPNYSVSLAERIFPASDLSEQISTAGTEASGTGNMKFMLNGALTVGTLDGANIEMREEVGAENFYIFGNTVEELDAIRANYDPVAIYEKDPVIHAVLSSIHQNYFNPLSPGLFQELFHALTYGGDYYFLLADFQDYRRVQGMISRDFRDRRAWLRKAVLNVARSGKFSSDRTIDEYAKEIWNLKPVKPSPGKSALFGPSLRE